MSAPTVFNAAAEAQLEAANSALRLLRNNGRRVLATLMTAGRRPLLVLDGPAPLFMRDAARSGGREQLPDGRWGRRLLLDCGVDVIWAEQAGEAQ
ncbi:hypothetical protein [Chitiniphilus eburneus]|uniref:hypothetical protein n=1 Tax=Chitiniphilus eburneus TaxID=2571148 RepID=UPI0035CECB61